MEDIAEAAELAKGTVYYYFKSKNEIFARLLERESGKILEEIRRRIPESSTFRQALEQTVLFYLDYFDTNRAFLKMFLPCMCGFIRSTSRGRSSHGEGIRRPRARSSGRLSSRRSSGSACRSRRRTSRSSSKRSRSAWASTCSKAAGTRPNGRPLLPRPRPTRPGETIMKKRTLPPPRPGAVLAAGAFGAPQDKMSLKQAVDLVLAQSDQVKMAAEAIVGAELKIDEAKSLYWPSAGLSANYLRTSFFGSFNFPMNGQNYEIKFGLPNSYRAAVGRQRDRLQLGPDGPDGRPQPGRPGPGPGRREHGQAHDRLPGRAVLLRHGLLQGGPPGPRREPKAFEKKLEIMTERYKAGLASTFETNLIQVQMAGLDGQKLDFENNIAKFRIAFNALAGRPEEAPFAPDAGLTFRAADFNRDELLKEAFAHRVEFQQVEHQAGLNQASLSLARTANKPTVAAAFNYEFRNGFMPIVEEIHGNWTAGITINYPAFDGFRTRAQVAQAESALRQTELRRGDVERTVTIEIESALSDLRTIEKKMDIEKIKIRQAEDALRIAEERFQNGLLSATDLVDAQNAVESARLNALQLVYSHVLGEYTLYRACGRKL